MTRWSDEAAVCNSSDLNEELGQINILFRYQLDIYILDYIIILSQQICMYNICLYTVQRQDWDADGECDGFQRGNCLIIVIYNKTTVIKNRHICLNSFYENLDDQACMGVGQYSEAELRYRRLSPRCSFSDLAGR